MKNFQRSSVVSTFQYYFSSFSLVLPSKQFNFISTNSALFPKFFSLKFLALFNLVVNSRLRSNLQAMNDIITFLNLFLEHKFEENQKIKPAIDI